MNLESIYYIGQPVAVAANLASLFAIWFQMRQSQKMARAAAQRELLWRVSEWSRQINSVNENSDNFNRGLLEYESSDASVQSIINGVLSEFVFICESALNMRNDGFFSDGTWAGIEGATLALLRTPGGQQWWGYSQHFIGSEIVERLNARLKEIDPDFPTFLDFTPTSYKRLAELGIKPPPRSAEGSASQDPDSNSI